MFQTCANCGLEIEDGQDITAVNDGVVFNYGEVEYANTEFYHSGCITTTTTPDPEPADAFDRLQRAEEALLALGVTEGDLMLHDLIQRVYDQDEAFEAAADYARESYVRSAFNHLKATGVYLDDNSEGYYSTVYEHVYDAMHAAGFIPEEG